MTGISTDSIPQKIDGPSLVAAASGLMLIPENASRLLRLHRLAALGMALTDRGIPRVSPSAIRSLAKKEDIGGPGVEMQEDPYSDVLIQSISFIGGPYLVSPGSGEHTVAVLENLINALFREPQMADNLKVPARQLIQGLLTVSDMVLKRAGLTRGTSPAEPGRADIVVPSAARLRELTEAAFVSSAELDATGSWLREVVDTFALDPGQLSEPCADDIMDDRLYVTPFLRLADGYRVVQPLDLLTTIRFHVLRFAHQSDELEELGKRWREAALGRVMRLAPSGSSPVLLERSDLMSRYLIKIDGKRDLHLVVATDTLIDWQLEVWGSHDSRLALDRIGNLLSPGMRSTYSSAEELVHLVIIDSPGRGAFWGVPSVDGADPMIIAWSDDLEVILHQEPDGLLGLLLFAQALENRSGNSISTGLLDEFCAYSDHQKSFYFSDDRPPTATLFQVGDGVYPRRKFYHETDRHGVVPPMSKPLILEARRRYERDAPEIFVIEPTSSYIGYVVELHNQSIFITVDRSKVEFAGVELELLECAAYWVRECLTRTGATAPAKTTELILDASGTKAWTSTGEWSASDPAVLAKPTANGLILEFTSTFVALLQRQSNSAERELVEMLLMKFVGVTADTVALALETVAPSGPKRMLNVFDQNILPDILAKRLPRPRTGHDQVGAQLLDELGEWLRSPGGGNYPTGSFEGEERGQVLNDAVGYLFERLEAEVALFNENILLDFLVAQNESLVHDSKFNAKMLRSRLECFGEQSHTVTDLVQHRKDSATAQRANRFLIEYVAAQPPTGKRTIELLDYYRVLAIATEIIERATISDFLHYRLADFEISILASGRLGVSREEPVTAAMETYAANSGARSVRFALGSEAANGPEDFDVLSFVARSEEAMRAEFGFTLSELREVCGGLLDLSIADKVMRIDRSDVISEIASKREMSLSVVETVLDGITLTRRESFLSIGQDALPWRYNRDMSYVRRPLVLQGSELVFGFRSIYALGPFWVDSLLSGRLQRRAETKVMQRCISEARRAINDAFARTVSARFQHLGMRSRVSVNKIGKYRIVDSVGNDLGDIDVLAAHLESRTILAIEAKDFEIARTPAEIANEVEKLFSGKKGKKSTVELHSRRIAWLSEHLDEVLLSLGIDGGTGTWQVMGAIVTSDPLITPLVSTSRLLVVPFDDLTLDALDLTPFTAGDSPLPKGGRKGNHKGNHKGKRKRR